MDTKKNESQEFLSYKTNNYNIMCVRDTILADAEESFIDEIGASLIICQHAMPSSTANIFQTSEMLLVENIYVSADL